MKGPQYQRQFFNLFSSLRLQPIKDSRLQSLKDHAVWALHLTIALRLWHWGIINFNAQIYTKVFELHRSELSPIISDNIIGNTKLVHDFFDGFHCLGRCDSSDRLYFDPLCEFIHCNEDVCESTFSFLECTYQIQPPGRKMLSNRYGLQLMNSMCFWWAKNWQSSYWWTRESASNTAVGQKNPYLYVLPTRDLAPMWLPQISEWMSCRKAHPSFGVMHFIRVSLALRWKSSSFTRVYCPAWWCNHSCSTLSSGKPPIPKYIMNGVCQSEWIYVTSGDSVTLSLGSGVSWDDLAALVVTPLVLL
jgi:hypothetical protein